MVELFDQATVSALIQAAGLAIIAGITKAADAKRDKAKADTDAKRAAEAKWRDSVDQKLEELAQGMSDVDSKVNRQIAIQAADTRSDIIHKCHRYLDDLGCASTEEKNALADEHKQYTEFCRDLEIDNNFIDLLVARVMELPERDM